MKSAKRIGAILGAILVALFAYLNPDYQGSDSGSHRLDGHDETLNASVRRAFIDRQSGVVLTFSGTVDRLLADDNEGSRHQRFIVRDDSGMSVLISHNIDLAPRIQSIAEGDSIVVKGEYEWNDRGGLIHWTHHDPKGWHEPGWIRHENREYQ